MNVFLNVLTKRVAENIKMSMQQSFIKKKQCIYI